ncbi:shikimate kinase [Staphylococcus hyicus]|uniref:shikimate kinase n=1 Tax=Staphylococcus hyicus TaxID=1284 RepID=UPI00208F7A70|nr:shikimate kinase [Staphylococcus hyicus]MCO4331313.1 shikimate kinase [Staphylococcus hyicus]MCO4334023.1 shikimate kinase [Staphylococcus hyicus]
MKLRILNKPILLIGFMGSGKTTIGKILSESLNLPFVDLDAKIVEMTHSTIPQIFETSGETEFRKLEYEQLKKHLTSPQVIATGGGIIEHDESFTMLKQYTSSIIWLDAPFENLYERIVNDENRPNARNKSYSDLKNLYSSRISRYNEIAFIKVNTAKTSRDILNEINKALFANDQY